MTVDAHVYLYTEDDYSFYGWGTGSLWPLYSLMEKSEAVRNEIIKISKNG